LGKFSRPLCCENFDILFDHWNILHIDIWEIL
jgi:hypothetical protein